MALPAASGHPLVLSEVKSVTANHWGDKSKEIYARAAVTRQAASIANREVVLIGVLDGDVDTGALRELATGLGYDIVLTARELLVSVATRRGISTPLTRPETG
jgi:hypothetical protein